MAPTLCSVALNICGPSVWEPVSCHHSTAWKFEVTPRFVANLGHPCVYILVYVRVCMCLFSHYGCCSGIIFLQLQITRHIVTWV